MNPNEREQTEGTKFYMHKGKAMIYKAGAVIALMFTLYHMKHNYYLCSSQNNSFETLSAHKDKYCT